MRAEKILAAAVFLLVAVGAAATMPVEFYLDEVTFSKDVVGVGEEFQVQAGVEHPGFQDAKNIGVRLEGPVEGSFEPLAADFSGDEKTKVFTGKFRVRGDAKPGATALKVGVVEGGSVRSWQTFYITILGEAPIKGEAKTISVPEMPSWFVGLVLLGAFWLIYRSR